MNSGFQENRKNIAVLFGGRSVEHEISIITGIDLISAIDTIRYKVTPVYITLDGRWFIGRELLDRNFYKNLPASLSSVKEVTLLPIPRIGGLCPIQNSKILMSPEHIVPIDVYIPAFHGQFGEDGCIQGLLEIAEAAYTSSPVAASAIAMNKYFCKILLAAHDIPVLPGVIVQKRELLKSPEAVLKDLFQTRKFNEFPLFIKPCNLGSSIGISRVKVKEEILPALTKVFKYDTHALIEPCLKDIMEINISVMDGEEIIASVTEIPVSQSGVLTYEDKYLRGGSKKGLRTRSEGMASLVRVIDAEDLDPDYKDAVTKHALKAFKLLGCSGIVRFDFMIDTSNGNLYFNELNPIPGSFAYYLWAKSKPPFLYTEALSRIIENAEKLAGEKHALQKDTGFKALSKG
ncbi:MAG: D-alanine--D-alanine ligase [SAR324 cluster bacterium]|uniref:D-alanine--D-alanine ligase n=1 Tax=SAR324 cluster bacterium TaxID=2024889 RepID=A0A7X9FSZ0_9DELT|nr:D-alanine--D-alanine ligase [SAR324 cluster bacterium]